MTSFPFWGWGDELSHLRAHGTQVALSESLTPFSGSKISTLGIKINKIHERNQGRDSGGGSEAPLCDGCEWGEAEQFGEREAGMRHG